ncbi:hypothetical protein ACSBR2_036386 [Camellia fascicularis]
MSVDRTQGSCVTIRTLSPLSSLSRCVYSSSDDATFGSPTRMGKGLTCVCFKSRGTYETICINLAPLQEERLRRLKHWMKVNFVASRVEHHIYSITGRFESSMVCHIPWSGAPWLSIRSMERNGLAGQRSINRFQMSGIHFVGKLIVFCQDIFGKIRTSFQCLLKKQGGKRAAWEYPFAVAGVNITFMIMQMLDLDATRRRTFVRTVFLQMLSENEWAFDLLYCVAFVVMDKQWLEKNATYMQFNVSNLCFVCACCLFSLFPDGY